MFFEQLIYAQDAVPRLIAINTQLHQQHEHGWAFEGS